MAPERRHPLPHSPANHVRAIRPSARDSHFCGIAEARGGPPRGLECRGGDEAALPEPFEERAGSTAGDDRPACSSCADHVEVPRRGKAKDGRLANMVGMKRTLVELAVQALLTAAIVILLLAVPLIVSDYHWGFSGTCVGHRTQILCKYPRD